jgi:L,D-transpeptidase ErfK/SrfK
VAPIEAALQGTKMHAWLRGWMICAAGLATWTSAAEYELPANGSSVIGTEERDRTRYEDTLVDIAHQHGIGYEEIARANPRVDLWVPGEGTEILLPGRHILPPGPREGIVINLPEHRLYYYPQPREGAPPVVFTFPVNIGRLDRGSPIGLTRVVAKVRNPSWFPPASIRREHVAKGDPLPAVVLPGPRNPLGAFELRLGAGRGTFLIHGTNTPWAIGMAITHGCIGMYPEDVAVLFQQVPLGTPVWMINAPVKVADLDGTVLLEAHPPLDVDGQQAEPGLPWMLLELENALGSRAGSILRDTAVEVLRTASGVPTVIARQDALDAEPVASGQSGR